MFFERAANRGERRALLLGQPKNRPALVRENSRRRSRPLADLDEAALCELLEDAPVRSGGRADFSGRRLTSEAGQKSEHLAASPPAPEARFPLPRIQRRRSIRLVDAVAARTRSCRDADPAALFEQAEALAAFLDVELRRPQRPSAGQPIQDFPKGPPRLRAGSLFCDLVSRGPDPRKPGADAPTQPSTLGPHRPPPP